MTVLEAERARLSDAFSEAGFVSVTDVIPDAILEIRYYSSFNFVGARIRAYDAPRAYLTREAASALLCASEELGALGYFIKIYDGYRPQTAVDHFKEWAEDLDATELKPYFYPDVDKSELFARGYIAGRSSHSRGSAVDLTLVDMRTGLDVDMGGEFDFFGEISHAYQTKGLRSEQIENRAILRRAMVNCGFEPLDEEWWHFRLKNEPYPDTYFDFPIA